MTIRNKQLQINRERIFSDISKARGQIEAALALGDTSKNAVLPILKNSMQASLMPTTNRMAILGIVHIPGLMSGMIIGGVNPIEAAILQIIIFLMILLAGFIAVIVVTILFTKEFFTDRDQLNDQIFLTFSTKKT